MTNSDHLGREVGRLESEKFKNRDFHVESNSVNKLRKSIRSNRRLSAVEHTQLIQ